MKKASVSLSPIILLTSLFLLAGCSGEKIFVANFSNNTVGQAPATQQEVGTVQIDGLSGNCVVAKIPNLAGNWVKINRPNNPATVTGLQCKANAFKGPGKYTFTSTLYIPDGDGVATIQFESFGQAINTYTSFLHIDFLKGNRIRVNDNDTQLFGSFPRNQPFIVQLPQKSTFYRSGYPGYQAWRILCRHCFVGRRSIRTVSRACFAECFRAAIWKRQAVDGFSARGRI